MLSVADAAGRDTGRMALLYALALLPISLLPTLLGVTGAWYFFGALALGIGYVAAGTGLLIGATPARAWRLFFVSILYLPALLTLMVLDKVAAYRHHDFVQSCPDHHRHRVLRRLPHRGSLAWPAGIGPRLRRVGGRADVLPAPPEP